jgi:hypothetical protein
MLAAILLAGIDRPVAAQTSDRKKTGCCCCCQEFRTEVVPGTELQGYTMIRTYPVADLVLQAHNATQPKLLRVAKEEAAWCCTPVPSKACPGAGPTCQRNIAVDGKESPTPVPIMDQTLVNLITHMIAPTSWEAVGGEGAIEYFPVSMELVIRQTPVVHEQISELLAALRRFQEVEVSVEVRLLSLSECFYSRFWEHLGSHVPCLSCTDSASQPMTMAFLTNIEESQLLDFVQTDPHGHTIMTPKLRMLNGQAATIELADEPSTVSCLELVQVNGQSVIVARNEPLSTRFSVSARPAVSADRRFVRLNLKVSRTDSGNSVLFPVTTLIEPVFEGGFRGAPVTFTQFFRQPTLESVVNIPDGGTVLLTGWTQMRQAPNDSPCPLAEVPLIGWLFDKPAAQPEREHVLLMVSLRIIAPEQKEERLALGSGSSSTAVMPPAKLDQKTPCCAERLCEALRLTGTCEAQECLPCPQKETRTAIAAPTPNWNRQVAELLEKYEEMCAKGQLPEAEALARQALALDPACFSSRSSIPQLFEGFPESELTPPTKRSRPTSQPTQLAPERVPGGKK